MQLLVSYTTYTRTYLIASLEPLLILLPHSFSLCKLCSGRGNTWSHFILSALPVCRLLVGGAPPNSLRRYEATQLAADDYKTGGQFVIAHSFVEYLGKR